MQTMEREKELIASKLRTIHDFPKQGVNFKDITTVLKDKEAFKAVINYLEKLYKDSNTDYIAAIESRGFIFGAALADRLNCGLVLIRKPGKLPAKTISQEYTLEYGTDKLEIHEDAIEAGKRVIIIDDLLATGGTAAAACNLISSLKADIAAVSFIIELSEFNGRNKFPAGIKVDSILQY